MLPEFTQAIKNTIQQALKGIHTSFPGRIEKYDPQTNLANVQPVMKFKKPNGDWIDYPLLTGVPVWFPQTAGQKATIAFPVNPGDECLVVVSERQIDYWMQGKETNTDLMFDLTESICIPGLFAEPNSVVQTAQDEQAIVIQRKDTLVKIKEKDIVLDCKETVTINSEKDIILNAEEKIELNADEIKMAGTSVSVDADVDVEGDITASEDVVAGEVSLSELAETVGSMEGPDSYSEEQNSGGGTTITIGE